MDDGGHGIMAFQPALDRRAAAAEVDKPAGIAAEHMEAGGWQMADHQRHGRFGENFIGTGNNADPDRADPVLDTGNTAQQSQDAFHILDQRIGHVDEADIRTLDFAKAVKALLGHGFPVLTTGRGKAERAGFYIR